MKNTNRATAFSAELRRNLAKLTGCRSVLGVTTWEKNWSVPGAEHDTVDVVGLRGNRPRVLIEVELRRQYPASNVVKIWEWINKKGSPRDVVLLQAFSKLFKSRKQSHQKRAQFVGGEMVLKFPKVMYQQVPFDYNPLSGGKLGGGARRRWAEKLAGIIVKKLKQVQNHR